MEPKNDCSIPISRVLASSRAEHMLQVLLELERFSGREIARAVSLGESL